MTDFLEALGSGEVLLMDGAMGTELQRITVPEDGCFEAWNLTHPDKVKAVHQAYVAAGARVLLTNTFQANPANLEKFGLGDHLEEIFQAALALARSQSSSGRFVLADIGPVKNIDSDTALSLVNASRSADGVLLETWSDPETAALFSKALASVTSPRPPLLVSFTFWRGYPGEDLRTFKGLTPETCARQAKEMASAALGVNCGRGLDQDDYLEIIRRYRSVTDLPVFVRPNAGTPTRLGDHWVYPETPARMAAGMVKWLAAGACMVGGCCGTTPEHIAAFQPLVAWQRHNPLKRN